MLATIAVLLTITATSAVAIDSLTEVETANDDMGSGASEFSGATYNPTRNVILTVDDEFNAYEFDLNPDGSIDHSEPVRVLTMSLPAGDWEGIAWMSGNRYALLSEGTGIAYIVDLPPSVTLIDSSTVAWQFNAGGPDGNTGSEGIAVGADGSFYVTDEMPAAVSKYTSSGSLVSQVLLPEIGDASGVVEAEDGSLIVISDESKRAVHYDIDFNTGSRTVVDTIMLSGFPQVEGIAIIGNLHGRQLLGYLRRGRRTPDHPDRGRYLASEPGLWLG